MWLARFFLALLAASVVAGLPGKRYSNPPIEPDTENPSRPLTKGVSQRDPDGNPGVRREIHDMKSNFPDQWNLYILGLRSFQMMDQDDFLSFYQIAGIHGMPFKPWGGADGIEGKQTGYCPHINILFLHWHRPYLALYEQELYKHVSAVAKQFSPALIEKYTAAAKSFRIPYWDWALGEDTFDVPEFFITPTIEVLGFDGLAQRIPNPLHHFQFRRTIPGDFKEPWAHMNTTLRWPTDSTLNAESDQSSFIRDAKKNSRQAHEEVGKAFFSDVPGFNAFNHRIEDIHGWMHGSVGGYKKGRIGHMWPTEYSAFEPLFMLHHCNVDRFFALWLDAYHGQSIEPNSTAAGTYALENNTPVDVNTPLSPFRKSETEFWTVNDAEDTWYFGYCYPETMDWEFNTAEEYYAHVNATIARLYSSKARQLLTSGQGNEGSSLSRLLDGDSYTDWTVDLHAVQSALPSAFIVEVSLVGDFSSDPVSNVGLWSKQMLPAHSLDWKTKSKLADKLEPNVHGDISLTTNMLERISAGELESLEASVVVPFLTEKLTWMVFDGDGAVIPPTQLQGLTVEVTSRQVRIPKDPDHPLEYSRDKTSYPEVTMGKGGGVKA
ncbi:Di-copper centre-containing protein [Lojkania enalia]|uniref:tyrosinase n=1 Tax=Lojkania enalia TaxID=147567 RepID=A0A9P4JVS4_9PLEO|nr:Di-copper centre-containing protein [Didymosphaeria enalia]